MADVPESKSRTADGRFVKGHPGGPGRPRKVVKAAADMLDQRVAEVAGDLFECALKRTDEGSDATLKMLLDRVWPVGRSRPLEIGVPEIKQSRDLLTAMTGVTNAVLDGDATAEEGAAVAKMLNAHRQAIELIDLEERVTELEEMTKGKK